MPGAADIRVLFVTFPEPGHFNPTVPVAQRLEREGTTVAYFAHADLGPRVARAGLKARTFSVQGAVDPASSRPLRTRALAERMQNPAWLGRWIAYTLLDVVPAQVEALLRAVDEFRPDVLCVDPLNYAGAIVGERLGLRWLGMSSCLLPLAPDDYVCALTAALPTLHEQRAELMAKDASAVRFRYGEAISPHANTVFTTEGFVPWTNGYSERVGPALPLAPREDEQGFPWGRLRTDVPIVYVAFGGGAQLSFAPQVFRALAGALGPDEAQLVMALGELAGESFVDELPAHVLAVGHAPQLALLPRIDVMVSHGGANSVMECLANGKPLLVLPLAHDQPLQARLVAESGAGISRSARGLAVEDARAALHALLADGPHRARAQAIGDSYRAHDGAARVVQMLGALARDGQIGLEA